MACGQHLSAANRPTINVMFLCDEWKSSKGGLSTFNREFAVNLAKIASGNIKVHCYVSQSDELSREDARQHGVTLITAQSIPGSVDPLDWLKFPPPDLLNPDIVVGHGRKFGTPAYCIVRVANCKWIHFVHVFCEDLGKFKATKNVAVDTIEENEKKHKIEIQLCKAADLVVAVGSRLQHKYSDCLPHVQVEIITPGIFEKLLNESSQGKSMQKTLRFGRTSKKKFKVFMFGRASFEDLMLKGYDIVAKAIVSCKNEKMFELTFVGSSSGEHRKIEQWFLEYTGISRSQLTIRGFCNEQEELTEMMLHEPDMVAIPSRTEGFGLVALEAISAGIPVLVAGETGIAEALLEVEGGKSVIVESDDPEEWARRIQLLSRQSSEERENNAKLLRDNYNKTYSWSNECERFISMIQGLVESSNGQCKNVAEPAEGPSHFSDEELRALETLTAESSSATSENVQDKGHEEMEQKLKKLEEIYSCLPPALIKRILYRDDVNGNIEIASRRLQEFQDSENPVDVFKNLAATPLIGTGEGTISRRADQPKNFRGKKRAGSTFAKERESVRDFRRRSFDDIRVENRGSYQANLGQNTRQRGENPNRQDQGNRGRPWHSGNKGRGPGGMVRAQSLSSAESAGQSAVTGANVKKQSRFERNQLLVCGLSASTTKDGLMNFIEAMSGEEVKEVMLSNNKALITMANDITDFRRIKTKGEKRGLDSAKVTIRQVPVCTSIVVSGIPYNTTRDAIQQHFESPRNSGGPVESVQFVPKSGRAVVVFQDPTDMERVLARQEEVPHVLNKAQLSIRIYNEFFESVEGDVSDDSGRLGPTASGTNQTQVSQYSKKNTKQLHIAVDPDVMEFITTSVFRDQLNNSLTAKRSEITWRPNDKMAVIEYQGEDSDSWQTECIDEVQNFLGKFAKCDVQVDKDFWDAVVAQLSSIRAILGVDPPLVKTIDDSFVARIVSLSSDVRDYEEKLKSKLEEIYREETRKSYLKRKVPNVPEERLILLKKIKFVEKLQEKNKELEIKLDIEGEEIYFEGPQQQFTEATMKFYKQMSDMVEKTLTLSDRILEVLSSDEGLVKVKYELENNNVEAVFVIDKDAKIVGTSAAHVDNAAMLVNKLMLQENVQVDDKSKYLLRSAEWRILCDEINTATAVRIHRNNWNDTYVAGFRDDVTEVMKKLTTFLETNCIRDERFVCPSQIVRKYLAELRQEDLRSIENQLKDFEVKIKNGKGNDDFDISGNKEGLIRARRKLDALVNDFAFETFDVKQPGLRKFFDSGKGDRLVKSVEKDHSCAIQVQKNFDRRQRRDDDDDHDDRAALSRSDASTLVATKGHHRISLSDANFEAEKEHQRHSWYSSEGTASRIGKDRLFSVEVINGDLTQEKTDAIMIINRSDMNMNNAGDLSKVVLRASGQQVQQECDQLGKQSAGSAVMTSGGNLNVAHIIHIIPGTLDKQHLQQCFEEGLRVADVNNLRSISIPGVGTSGCGLSVADSAQVTFQALNNFSGRCKSVRKVRVVVFQAQMMQELLQEQKRNSMQDLDEEESDSSSDETGASPPRLRVRSPIQQASLDRSVRICVIGNNKARVQRAAESLKKGFSEACITEKVEREVISQLSNKQIVSLRRKAEDRDVKLVVEADAKRIVVRGQPVEVSDMVGEIWKEIGERTRKTQKEVQAQLVARNIQWSYKIHGSKMAFCRKTNAKIEMACSKDEPRVQVSLRGDQFVIDLKAKTGRGQRTGEQITLTRKVKGTEEGIALPEHWDPMPSAGMTVHKVVLLPGSSEYQDALCKVQATAGGVRIQKIERIQNPRLYQSYMVRKQKMDKDIGGNSERQLFHGTDAKSASHISTQGFNRSFSGVYGISYGRGVHFARDAQYTLCYPPLGREPRYLYLARVLVGQYCVGNSSLIVPPPKNPSIPEILYESVVDNLENPSIFVVFYDNQCYPEYLITLD